MTALIIDTDIQDDVDDVGALAVACALARRGVATVGISISTPSVWGARAATAVLRHYGVAAPVALERGDDVFGPEEFARGISRIFGTDALTDFEAAVPMMRRAIASADESVTIAAIGFHSHLVGLLESGPDEHSDLTGRELVRDVRLVVMGGSFVATGPAQEYNFARSPELTTRLFDRWPGPVDVIPWEVGASIATGRDLIDRCGYDSPVTLAYLLHSGHRVGRPSWDPITVLAAADQPLPGLRWSEPGTVVVGAMGESTFRSHRDGTHRIAALHGDGAELGHAIDDLLYAPTGKDPA